MLNTYMYQWCTPHLHTAQYSRNVCTHCLTRPSHQYNTRMYSLTELTCTNMHIPMHVPQGQSKLESPFMLNKMFTVSNHTQPTPLHSHGPTQVKPTLSLPVTMQTSTNTSPWTSSALQIRLRGNQRSSPRCDSQTWSRSNRTLPTDSLPL